jgi:hypothetical protein
MKIIDYLKNHLGANDFGTTRKTESMDIAASAAYGHYKSKSKTRNFWDKACFVLIDDSWDHNSDSELFEESNQLENEIIPYFEENIVGEYSFINSDNHNEMNYLTFPSWPAQNQIEPEKLNEQYKYILYVLDKEYFAEGWLNEGFKLMTIMFVVSEIDWSVIENIPENLLLIYDDRAKQIDFPETDNRIKVSFQEMRSKQNNNL